MPARSLAGKTILLTRPAQAHDALAAGLRDLGARVLRAAVIRTAPPSAYSRLDAALRRLESYDAALFASARAVESVFARARSLGLRVDSTLGSGWPYGGPHTSIDLASPRLRVDHVAVPANAATVAVPNLGAGEKLSRLPAILFRTVAR